MRWLLALALGACSSGGSAPSDAGAAFDAHTSDAHTSDAEPSDATTDARPRRDAAPFDPSQLVDASVYEYTWTCRGEVPPTGEGLPAEAAPPVEDCSAGVWPDVDPTVRVCPTMSEGRLDDPASGLTFPLPEDTRGLPVEIPVSESGSFLPSELPTRWPATRSLARSRW